MNAYEWTEANYPKINKEEKGPVVNYNYVIESVEEAKKQTVQKELPA